MTKTERHPFPPPVKVLLERRLPERATPAGYSALIAAYELAVPVPSALYATGERHRIVEEDGWRILTPRHAPKPTLAAHLTFALKHEGLDLAVLKRLFLALGPEPIELLVRTTPTGAYARRVWFLYEWLTGRRLDLPDATGGRYVPVVDRKLQYATAGESVARQRVHDNLPGTPAFCPLVFRTPELERQIASDLSRRAHEVIDAVPRDVLARTAAFLLLNDSRASYAIEGERPARSRIERWGRAIGEAGRHDLDADELLRLQALVIGDARFVTLGFRQEGGFVGEHDRSTRMPLPDHVSARPNDVPDLIRGVLECAGGRSRALDPVIAAAVIAFGFVYVHPFEDGNGRIHRYLIHHVLARHGFAPPGIVFPVSAAILDQIDAYRAALERYAERLLPVVEWRPTPAFNVEVLNDTGDFYRFFDATPHAEFLYACVRQTIEEDLPAETAFLRNYDVFRASVEELVDMPERTIDLLYRFLRQHDGTLSRRARTKELAALSDDEVERIEAIYAASFHELSG
ncbi:MAG: Fic family protein [Trueperaceae bacterium]